MTERYLKRWNLVVKVVFYQKRMQSSILDGPRITRVWRTNSISISSSPHCELWVQGGLLLRLRKVLCLGINCKIGDLMRLAGVCINDGACGLIRQYTWNLTSCHSHYYNRWGSGTAWLSTARVVECSIELLNGHDPIYITIWCTSSQYGLNQLGDTRATCG
jgi:hypothetical protein